MVRCRWYDRRPGHEGAGSEADPGLQARGRSERGFGTWQGRLPQELRIRGIRTLEEANHFLGEEYCREFNQRFSVAASAHGTAFVPLRRKDLDLVFSVQHERVVARDNTVSFANKVWQLERSKLRATLAGCRVTIHQHLDETLSITFGPHLVGRFQADGQVLKQTKPAVGVWESPAQKQRDFPHSHSHYCWIFCSKW